MKHVHRLCGLGFLTLVIGIGSAALWRDQPAVRAAADGSGPSPATSPAVAPSTAAAPGRPTTRPGRFGPGDLLLIDAYDLMGPAERSPKPVRVEADGTVRLLYLDNPVPIAGMTAAEAQAAIVKLYRDAKIVERAMVYVRRLAVGSADDPLLGPIKNFDLLRVTLWNLAGPGSSVTHVGRVGADGTFVSPYTAPLKVAGLTAGEVEVLFGRTYKEERIIEILPASVLRLEVAPSDADRLQLPDVPIRGVPDEQRWLYELDPVTGGRAGGRR